MGETRVRLPPAAASAYDAAQGGSMKTTLKVKSGLKAGGFDPNHSRRLLRAK